MKTTIYTSVHARKLKCLLFFILTFFGSLNAYSHVGHKGGAMNNPEFLKFNNPSQCLNPYWQFEKKMSKHKKILQARKGGPHISKNATIMARNQCGELRILQQGSNEFVCLPNADPVPVANPVCLDEVGFEWYQSIYFGTMAKPTGPGVGFMAQGGAHWERDGEVFLPFPVPDGATLERDPPHWMLLWEFDAGKTGLPPYPNTGDVTIVFDGTPFAVMLLPWDSLCSSERRYVGCLDSLEERNLP